MKHFISLLAFALVVCTFMSCSKDKEEGDAPTVPVRHVVLFYMVSENSLLGADNDDIREILTAKSDMKDDEEIIIYIDNNKYPAIYRVTNKTTATMFSEMTPIYQYPEEHNSDCEESLTDFLTYVRNNVSAENYSMVFWSHGSGWVPSDYSGDSQDFVKARSFGYDNGQNINIDSGNRMSISAMHKGLQSFGKKFNYIFFDCCFMQSIEIDYEMRDVADYIISSPAETPYDGANYRTLVGPLFDETTFAKTIPEAYYNAYYNGGFTSYGIVISSVDCSKLDTLMQATKQVVDVHLQTLLTMSYELVFNYFEYDNWRSKFEMPDYYDMNGIFKTLLPEDEYKSWKSVLDLAVPYAYATDSWYTSFGDAFKFVDRSQFSGISMYVPLEKYSTDSYASGNAYFVNGYKQSQWAKAIYD